MNFNIFKMKNNCNNSKLKLNHKNHKNNNWIAISQNFKLNVLKYKNYIDI